MKLRPGLLLPMQTLVTLSSGTRTVSGAASATAVADAPWDGPDEQMLLLTDLVEVMTRDIPSLDHILQIIDKRLASVAGLTAASVFTLDADEGGLVLSATLGPAAYDDLKVAGKVFRVPAGHGLVHTRDNRAALRLRIGGQTMGVAVLTGDDLEVIRPEAAAAAGLQLAATLQVLAAERARHFTAHATETIRKLFEEGTAQKSVEAAGALLARATGEAFRTEMAAVHLIGPDGLIRYAAGVGDAEGRSAELAERLIGKAAADSPVWQAMREANGPILVNVTTTAKVRQGGIADTLGMRCFLAMPLMSAAGPVGLVMCGDASGTRQWTARDRSLAGQLAMEGALIVDSARMRQAEEQHVAELTRQAYHDALTGLANRAHLLERADQQVALAKASGSRMALLLIDLDGFKKVNDTVGHHAGDALLQAVGVRLQSAVREDDIVARLGGDEFAILLTRNPDPEAVDAVAARLHERLRDPIPVDDGEVRVGASIGVAFFPRDAQDMTTLMRRADAAMYLAKRSGGGVFS